MNKSKILGMCMLFVLFSISVYAIPQSITVNGLLTDSNNDSLTGTYEINFTIYDNATGGNVEYNTIKNVTTDANGVYNVVLSGLDIDFSEAYYLGVQIESDAEMTPRLNLTSSPYAFSTSGLDAEINLSHDVNIDGGTLFIDADGDRIGIGLTTPEAKLHVNGTIRVDSGLGYISTLYSNGLEFNRTSLNYIDLLTGGGLAFRINYSTKMILTTDGKVGIGATNPLALLSVGGDGEAASFSVSGQSGLRNIATFRDVNGENVFQASGSVSEADLEVSFGDMDEAGNGNYFKTTDSKTYFIGGNVGIGTTTPSSTLHINGTVNDLSGGLAFGDGASGIFEKSDDTIYVWTSGSRDLEISTISFKVNTPNFMSTNSNRWKINGGSNPSDTTATFLVNQSDTNTGIGGDGSDQLSLIAGGKGLTVANVSSGMEASTTEGNVTITSSGGSVIIKSSGGSVIIKLG